ncbi:thiamine phosphate synthase [Oceanirhabdus seepicola]|uniref:Thiamine phosphate synthase n=1 Tax=Oceanirhabdus seepicola TaxID=2828781 RepID=A0A9J6NUM9_9CLOT|nr:thiamine phosphate synthase [Oceanirhabdus seepicola]MCM1988175.1 thiamine phosphate synthase [Oceanirhabdus seepicola]
MSRSIIVAITDHRDELNIMIKKQKEGIKHGVNIVIVRGYDSLSDIDKICKELRVLKEQYDFQLIINAYPTKELLNLKPDGFHLNVKNMEKIINNRVDLNDFGKIGVSAHNKEEIKLTEKVSPDYALISPIFQPSCKNTVKTLGITGLEKMIHDFYEIYQSQNKIVPKLIALGGIKKHNYLKLLGNTCLDGIALMSAIQEIKDIL